MVYGQWSTDLATETGTVGVVGKAKDWGSTAPQGTASVGIALVLLEKFQVLQEHNTVSYHQTPNFLQMAGMGCTPSQHIGHTLQRSCYRLTFPPGPAARLR